MKARNASHHLTRLILRSRAISAFTRVFAALWRGVSKDEAAKVESLASWFETRSQSLALLTMRR